MPSEFEQRYFSGQELYGDDFAATDILRWFQDEEHGYYDLADRTDSHYTYEYHALNRHHAYRFLKGQKFGTCVALGCARGDGV